MRSSILLALCALSTVPAVAAPAAADGFVPIFDGKTLTGWDGDPGRWRVEDGAITGQTTTDKPLKENTFIIWRQGEVDDFELKAEFRMDGGNSGIQYRSFEKPGEWSRWVVGGYQADIDASNTYTGIMYGERYRGILAMRGEQTVVGDDHKPKVVGHVGKNEALRAAIRAGEWNQYRIIARGNHFVHEINGKVMSEVTDEDKADRRKCGIVALQLHAGPPMKIQFRNILLKRLPLRQGRKVVFVATRGGHGYGGHEHVAGSLLLARLLNSSAPDICATVYREGWPADPTAFDNADAVVVWTDGGEGSLLDQHAGTVADLARKGVGMGVLHWGLDVPKGPSGDALLGAIGGYFEQGWSVNPTWTADFKQLPDHPVCRGVRPFPMLDEWYYNMRFARDMAGITPLLTAVPPDETRKRPDGPYSNNAFVRAHPGRPEIVAWACDRTASGGRGRGFGFTGGHLHWAWADDNYRKLVLNAVAWIAGAEIPDGGIATPTPSLEELEADQDEAPPKDFDREGLRKRLTGRAG